MKLTPSALLATIGLQAVSLVNGAHFSARGMPRRSSGSALSKRAEPIVDLNDLAYYLNITLGGVEFEVQLDTGSSDLWVAGTVPNAKTTGVQGGVSYAVGSDSGPIMTADMTWDGYDFTITDQAFIQVTPSDDNPEGQGLVGLGPNEGSTIYASLNGSAVGDTPLNRIFLTNTSTPNYITVALGRSNFSDPDATSQFPGDFTIGEVLPQYSNITSQPQLNITLAQNGGNQHWMVLLDSNGVTAGSGANSTVKTTTNVAATSDKSRLTFVFDTGFTFPQVPADLAKAFYGGVPGAELINSTVEGEVWVMPCVEEVNITFSFGGVSFPIHPLDATMQRPSLNNDSLCMGTFEPIASNAAGSDYDGIMGMAFLRNAYLLVNFGDFVDGNTSAKADGYTQLLPTTNAATAHAEFVKVRGSGSLPSTAASGEVSASSVGHKIGTAAKRIAIIAGIVGGVLLLAVLGFCCWCCKRRSGGRYRQLNEPAPMAAVDVHAPATYVPYNETQYQTAWDHRG